MDANDSADEATVDVETIEASAPTPPQPPAKTATQKMILKSITRAEAAGDSANTTFLRNFWAVDDGGAFTLPSPCRADTSSHVSADLARGACAASHGEDNTNRNLICIIAADWLGHSPHENAISEDGSDDLHDHEDDESTWQNPEE